jgi:tetratricopeptide (TPR) repeat protein
VGLEGRIICRSDASASIGHRRFWPLAPRPRRRVPEQVLERYEAVGEERDFLAAKPLYERALAEAPDARLLNDYGYLLFAHCRNELRCAVELFEQAIALDPTYDKPHFRLIAARASLLESAVVIYERRLAASPSDPREHRFLAAAYLLAHAYERALAVVEAGLALAPRDAALVGQRGEAKAGLGDAGGPLADWRRALELEPENIGARYSSAFLLERVGRFDEATAAWRSIVEWNEARGYALQTAWPERELERLRSRE